MARIWIADANPFKLSPPPPWWQQIVFDYDKMLRVLPSCKDRVYRLARLVRREARLGLQTMTFHEHPDTQMMIRHGLIPVSTIFPWAIHSTKILRDLKARDLWHNGARDEAGLERLIDQIDDQDNRQREAQDRQTAIDLDHRNADGYRYMKAMLGERINLSERDRARCGKTAGTDKTRVKVAMPGRSVSQSPQSPPAPGVPSTKTASPIRGIVLTDA